MGNILTAKIQKLDKRYKLAFIGTFVIGLLVHLFKFTNNLPNQDSLSNFYASQNILASGRWFLSISCALSSFFDLPWIIGLFSLFWLALTAVLLVRIFRMTNTTLILLTGGLLVTFPAVTEIFFYEYTADGYMMAIFLAALAVELTVIHKKGILRTVGAAVCVMLCCGIYQAYVSFALMLSIAYFALLLLEGKEDTRTYFSWIGRQAIVYGAGLAGYYVAWKICMHFQSVTATDYQGIDSVGFSGIGGILISLKTSVVQLLDYFANGFLTGNRTISLLLVLNALFLVALAVVVVVAFLRTKLYKRKLHTLLFLICLAAVPVAVYLWLFASSNVSYIGMRMKQSICVLFILCGILAEKYLKPRWSNLVALLLAVIVVNSSVTANIM